MSTDSQDHHCPGCGVPCKLVPRYPWHFCNACRDTASDADGRRLVFGNASLSGGFVWGFADEETRYVGGPILCLIKSRPALVGEARFGGTVAQPYLGPNRKQVDLRKPGFDRSKLATQPTKGTRRAP